MVTQSDKSGVPERPWYDGWFEGNQDECILPPSRYPTSTSTPRRQGTGQSEADQADDNARHYDFGGDDDAIDE